MHSMENMFTTFSSRSKRQRGQHATFGSLNFERTIPKNRSCARAKALPRTDSGITMTERQSYIETSRTVHPSYDERKWKKMAKHFNQPLKKIANCSKNEIVPGKTTNFFLFESGEVADQSTSHKLII